MSARKLYSKYGHVLSAKLTVLKSCQLPVSFVVIKATSLLPQNTSIDAPSQAIFFDKTRRVSALNTKSISSDL